MMKTGFFSMKTWAMRFMYAFSGILNFIRTEQNAIIYALASGWLIALSVLMKVSLKESIALLIAAGLVWICEMFNTAIEKLSDVVCPEKDHRIKIIKDVAAGAVLMAAIIALVIGLLIFIPKFL